jgi:hypothetical protein
VHLPHTHNNGKMVQIQWDTIVTSSDLPPLNNCEPRIHKVAKFGIIIEAERGFHVIERSITHYVRYLREHAELTRPR